MYNSNRSENFDNLQGIFSISYLESQQAPRKTFHLHDAYEIMLVNSNNVILDVNDESDPVPFGSILLFNTIDLHRIRYNGKDLYKRYVIWFKHDFLNEIEPLRHMLLKCFYVRGFDKANLLFLERCQNKKMIEIFNRLAEINENGDNTTSILRKLVLGELLTLINELYFSSHSFFQLSNLRDVGSIYNAIQFIQEN